MNTAKKFVLSRYWSLPQHPPTASAVASVPDDVAEGTAVNFTVSSGPGPEQSAQFELIIPEDGTVVATLTDAVGTSVLYQKECVAGERVQQSFLYHGAGKIVITCNGEEIWSKEY